jgi:hypothetical protein
VCFGCALFVLKCFFALLFLCSACFDVSSFKEKPLEHTPPLQEAHEEKPILTVRNYGVQGFLTLTHVSFYPDKSMVWAGLLQGALQWADSVVENVSSQSLGYVLKTDAEGQLQWHVLAGVKQPWIPTALHVDDRGVLTVGVSFQKNSPCETSEMLHNAQNGDVAVMRFRHDGQRLGCKAFSYEGYDVINGVRPVAQNQILVHGRLGTDQVLMLDAETLVLKNTWHSTNLKPSFVWQVFLTNQGGYLMYGGLQEEYHVAPSVWAVGPEAGMVWQKTFTIGDAQQGFESVSMLKQDGKGAVYVVGDVKGVSHMEKWDEATGQVLNTWMFSAEGMHSLQEDGQGGFWWTLLKKVQGVREGFLEHRNAEGGLLNRFRVYSDTGQDVARTHLLSHKPLVWMGECEEGCTLTDEKDFSAHVQGVWRLERQERAP